MRPRNTLISALVCAAAACSPTINNPTATSPTPSTSQLPKNGAPAVVNPLTNTTSIESDPCSAVTVAQVEDLGGKVKNTTVDGLSLGKNCAWIFNDGAGNIGAGMVTGNKEGLSSLYYQSTHGGLTTFKPVSAISGYPAVIYANGGERTYACTLAVGVRDDLVYTIISQLNTANPYYSNACDLNIKLAELAIQHLKGA
jgi:hypothetical protein